MINTVEKYYSPEGLFAYKVTFLNGEVWSVPKAEDNTDYQAILEWVADGNTIQEGGRKQR